MQTINEAQESRDEFHDKVDNQAEVLNGGKNSLVAPRLTDYWSGQNIRSHSNQNKRSNFKHAYGKVTRNVSIAGSKMLSPTNNSDFKIKTDRGSGQLRPYPSHIGDGLRPYELWKK